jgi:salicylate synthetase
MFGHVGFNYGAHVRDQSYTPGRWPILSIMVPELDITVRPKNITVQGYDQQQLNEVCELLENTSTADFRVKDPQPVNTQDVNEKEYKMLVSKALAEIRDGKYTKILSSRFVDLHRLVDMPATLLHGRRASTPARSYIMNHGGFQAAGFSPELVMGVQDEMVVIRREFLHFPTLHLKPRLASPKRWHFRVWQIINASFKSWRLLP